MKVKIGGVEIRIEADGNKCMLSVFTDGELLDKFPAMLSKNQAYELFYIYAGQALQAQRGG